MLLIPAIDLRGGKCVRLYQGMPEKETVYALDPVRVACAWEEKGAPWLHVVDLDGALSGAPRNLEIVREIAKQVKIPVQLGGGLRTPEAVAAAFAAGVSRVILGTAAIRDPAFLEAMLRRYGEKIAVSLDVREGKVKVEGWQKEAALEPAPLAQSLARLGLKRLIYTDVSRDGTLQGPNLEGIKEILTAASLKVIASGGISSLEDLRALKPLAAQGLEGAILGKALYAGRIRLEEALELCKHL